MDMTKIPRLAIPENVRPYIPLIVGLLPETVTVKGKVIQFRTTLLKAVSDGDLDAEDLLAFMIAYASAPNAPVILPPNVQPVPAPPAPPVTPPANPANPATGLLSWIEECWHDWFKGEDPNLPPDSDWAPGGGPVMTAILAGKRNLPPGASIRFMAEVPPAGSQLHPGIIAHVFEYQGQTFRVASDSTEEYQPFGDLAHVVRGDRWRKANGWDVTLIRLANRTGSPQPLTYHVEDVNGRTSVPVTITVGHS